MPWQILSEQTDPIKVTLFYCIQSEHTNLHAGRRVHYSFSPFPGCGSFSHTHFLFSLRSQITHFHIRFPITHLGSHAHPETPPPPLLVSLAHVFHLILPFLCLLTSLYSQLSIGTIPANYPQCHSHYFPISTANLLHTFLPPHPSRTRQLPDSFQQTSALRQVKRLKIKIKMGGEEKNRKKRKDWDNGIYFETLIRAQPQTGVTKVRFIMSYTHMLIEFKWLF